ncbi:MAG: ATP synthase F1 subunit delta [Candidatus Omnitrophica bacterium]|nr:ATP synthase F1 subunit delta [Candidatus Omnitrophota bacterium]
MDGDILAKRYGDAFLAFAKDGCGVKKGVEDMEIVNRLLAANPDLERFLLTPGIDRNEKFQLLENVTRNGLSGEIGYFLRLLLEKSRFDKFGFIANYVRRTYSHGIEVDALLKVSYPLETDMIRQIKTVVEEKMHKKLHMYIELDPDILGGIYLKIGNMLIDGSIKRRLEDMRAKLLAMKVVPAHDNLGEAYGA